eukprot:CAMPEP_0172436152 /NCGR_PEP_ID=MMETSP1064-20121228/71572_1 /TAXON_ID=202472 /ORGANISM="Aulacoseira subarctica , Strain CCAP 1002/5" /LENGTH=281 /DNA_ID=CAMNT_0013184543 /DNA_START=178 /DNA_END=1023 /DNA_ORIENTATION=+
MSGGGKTTFLRQLEQLAEVTSASPIKVWNRPHALHDTDAGILHTPPRIRLFPPFPTHGKLSKSNEVEHSPVEPSKIESIQPCAEVSPGLGKEILFNKVEHSPVEPSKIESIQPCAEVSPSPGKEISFVLDAVEPSKIESIQPCAEVSPSPGKEISFNEIEQSPVEPVEPSKIELIQPCVEVSPSPGKEISFVLDCILAKLAKKEVEESPDQFSKANLMLPCEEVLSHPARKRSPSPLSMEDNLTKVPKMEKSRGNNSDTFSEQQSDGVNDSDDADSGFYTQ